MNGFPKRASNGSKTNGKPAPAMDLPTAIKMLPLVERVVADLLAGTKQLEPLVWEQERLDAHRRELLWPERARRYQIEEEVRAIERTRKSTIQELQGLGLSLVDGDTGRIGFPTIVNGKPAFFSWQPGETSVDYWHFQNDRKRRRAIPSTWSKVAAIKAPAPRKRAARRSEEI